MNPRGRKVLRVLAFVVAGLAVLLAIGISLTIGWRPVIGAKSRTLTDRRFEASPARLARGKYIVENVSGCLACHSKPDTAAPGLPPVPGSEGAGNSMSDSGLAWLYAGNITPDKETGAGNWSDDALARGIREGIGHDGRALFPLMPYGNYRYMSDEDLASVVTYLRSIAPVKNNVPRTQIPFPLSRLILTMPEPIEGPVPQPDLSTPVKRGDYLVKLADCVTCHTAADKGQPMPGLTFAGGFPLQTHKGQVFGPNITPDPSGIGYYSEASFIHAMRTGMVGARKLNDVMPWGYYKGMTDEDLKAMFAYLRTLPAVKHIVDNTEQPALCAVCNQRHGGGERNVKAGN